jgi:hypothetical protein
MAEESGGPSRFTRHQLVALVIGAFLFLLGLVGFFFLGDPEDGALAGHDTRDLLLGLELNALQNVVHLVLGIGGLAGATGTRASRAFGLVLGVVCAALFVFGLVAVGNVDINVFSLNWPDNILHGVLALLGFGLAFLRLRKPEHSHSRAAER